MKYEEPELCVMWMEADDVVTVSGGGSGTDIPEPEIPVDDPSYWN